LIQGQTSQHAHRLPAQAQEQQDTIKWYGAVLMTDKQIEKFIWELIRQRDITIHDMIGGKSVNPRFSGRTSTDISAKQVYR
jgi:hypothetical protein